VRSASSLWSFQVWPVWVYTVLIFVLGSLPSPPPGPASLDDKALHLIGFAVLAVLSCRALRHLRAGSSVPSILTSGFLVTVAAGGALELWQAALSYRSCELLDWVADALGAVLGVAASAGWFWLSRSRTLT
jgi:VanZ family protein